MSQPQPLDREQREETFREYHAEHLRRQTAAIESIRAILMTFVVLTVIGAVILFIGAAQGLM